MKVYLSGGMRSNWQDRVINACQNMEFIDPRTHGLEDPKKYTEWDLNGVLKSDIIFAYFEAGNPSGFGLALEIGYAKALNKRIILADEKSLLDDGWKRRLAIVRGCADEVCDTLDDAILFLQTVVI